MSPRISLPVTLRGRFVELEPLHEGRLGPLAVALPHPEVFAGGRPGVRSGLGARVDAAGPPRLDAPASTTHEEQR